MILRIFLVGLVLSLIGAVECYAQLPPIDSSIRPKQSLAVAQVQKFSAPVQKFSDPVQKSVKLSARDRRGPVSRFLSGRRDRMEARLGARRGSCT